MLPVAESGVPKLGVPGSGVSTGVDAVTTAAIGVGLTSVSRCRNVPHTNAANGFDGMAGCGIAPGVPTADDVSANVVVPADVEGASADTGTARGPALAGVTSAGRGVAVALMWDTFRGGVIAGRVAATVVGVLGSEILGAGILWCLASGLLGVVVTAVWLYRAPDASSAWTKLAPLASEAPTPRLAAPTLSQIDGSTTTPCEASWAGISLNHPARQLTRPQLVRSL